MFKHEHPYAPFLYPNTKKLIVGTLPPPRFSTGELLEQDVDFCYGSYYNSLWLYIDEIHKLNLRYDNSKAAITQRKNFLIRHNIGICDIVAYCYRNKIDASDLGMFNITLRNIIGYLNQYKTIDTILFTGGNSKNGPEFLFRKHIKLHNIKLMPISSEVPRVHEFYLEDRKITTVSLTSPSGSANRAIGSLPLYRQLKAKHPEFSTFDFRVLQYSSYL